MYYTALHHNNNLLSCLLSFFKPKHDSCFPLSKPCELIDYLNPHYVPSKNIFKNWKYAFLSKSYGDLYNSIREENGNSK